jgi:hypothetical protein
VPRPGYGLRPGESARQQPQPTRHNRASRPAQPGTIRTRAARFAEKALGLTETNPQSKLYYSYESNVSHLDPKQISIYASYPLLLLNGAEQEQGRLGLGRSPPRLADGRNRGPRAQHETGAPPRQPTARPGTAHSRLVTSARG